ncbi:hypothetical protein EVAR_87576_1 [Eumeta japonica]|uniref:Uncharacterized protein n=1 Tax=Eumeta variegata TaxID=151549 RepID=A0A4C1WLN8_EUMVA|nr:hypothetical protein EVAR_87576_1 [Eumeta japonica]
MITVAQKQAGPNISQASLKLLQYDAVCRCYGYGSFEFDEAVVAAVQEFLGCVRPLSLFHSDTSADGVEERSLVPRSRSHARLRRNATMSHAFSRNANSRSFVVVPSPPKRTDTRRSDGRTRAARVVPASVGLLRSFRNEHVIFPSPPSTGAE